MTRAPTLGSTLGRGVHGGSTDWGLKSRVEIYINPAILALDVYAGIRR